MANITLKIDGQAVSVPSGTTVMDAAWELGIEIPALCQDKSLPVVSACRLCIVEVGGGRKLQTSCSLLARDGMDVRTETDRIVRYRRAILQLLLDSHPNDCLTCDKAGECLLQKYAWRYGVRFREHEGTRRPEHLDLSSPYIAKDDSKCILCGKCVRVCYQVEEERQVLAFAGRGYGTRIVADDDRTLEETDRRAARKGRAWDLTKEVKRCRVCDYGCSFEVLKRNGKGVAVKAQPPGRPLCLKGRLTTELLNVADPDAPYRKVDGKFQEASWAKALGLQSLLERLSEADGQAER